MNPLYKIFVSSIFLMLIISSCTERIEVKLDETYDRLIVEANITTDTMAHSFYLSKTSSYFANQASPKVSGASIKLEDNLGNTLMLNEIQPGHYVTPNDFYGIPGRTYNIQIDLAESIGNYQSYSASSELVPVNPIDSIGIAFNRFMGRNGFWFVKLYSQDPGGIENFYMFRVYNNGQLLSDTLDKVSLTDDRLFDGNYTYGIGAAYFEHHDDNPPFKIGDTVVLEMSGLNKEHFNFLNEVIRTTSFQNPMFGGPPANVKGNINHGAFGFFGAYSTTYSSLIITEDNIDYIE